MNGNRTPHKQFGSLCPEYTAGWAGPYTGEAQRLTGPCGFHTLWPPLAPASKTGLVTYETHENMGSTRV